MQVAVVKCSEYRREAVEEAVREGVEMLGGMSVFLSPGQKVLLKPNLLSIRPPERAVTTHPAVVEAVVKMVQEAGSHPLIADSPGNAVPYTKGGLKRLYRVSGMLEVAERTGAALNWDVSSEQVSHPEGALMKRLDIIRPALECDVLISLPKLKTHVLTTLTGATKNLFGLVPGYAKLLYHAKLHSLSNFSAMLLDVTSYAKPSLVVMDAIVGMDGNGPSGGRPRLVGVVLVGRDNVAVDAVAAKVVGIEPLAVSTLKEAVRRGWWSGRMEDIEVLGASIEEVRLSDFVPPVTSSRVDSALGLPFIKDHIRPLLINLIALRPVPQRGQCTACGTCVRACPMQAIEIEDRLAVVNYNNCIRCYCCHELCPENAISLEHSRLRRFLGF